MRLALLCLVAGLITCGATYASTVPKRWQWTTAQASTALMAQRDGLYVTPGYLVHPRLETLSCHGRGAAVARRFTGFVCNASFITGAHILFAAKTRRGGGLCWSIVSSPIPSGCLAKGARGTGDVTSARIAMTRLAGTINQGFYCLANGAGFFSCSWMTGSVTHRGRVIFTSAGPAAKVLS